jgi:calcineurin-like phosphoesterase family protein
MGANIYSLEPISRKTKSIFLAGPTMRISENFDGVNDSWRLNAINLLRKAGFTGNIIVPEFKNNTKPNGWSYEKQIEWEILGLSSATVILFWIPRELNKLPAFTTNIEFGEWLHSGKIVIGAPSDAPKNDYLKARCNKLKIQWNNTLLDTVSNAINKISSPNNEKNIFFTSDTHFNQVRTLELSKRPFDNVEQMDDQLIRNWNKVVNDDSIIFHLGDFGDPTTIKYLNGKQIIILPGNYDDEKVLKILSQDRRVKIVPKNFKIKMENIIFQLIHSIDSADKSNNFFLFGHTHGRQMVKRQGLDVGVDCHNYTPISMDDVIFYYNAITKFYDENVFSETIPPTNNGDLNGKK